MENEQPNISTSEQIQETSKPHRITKRFNKKIFFAVGVFVLLLGVFSTIVISQHQTEVLSLASSSHIAIPVVEDSYVSSTNINKNYGKGSELKVDTDKATYLKFDLGALKGQPVYKATLHIYVTNASKVTQRVSQVAGNNWFENTLTFANQPEAGNIIAQISNTTKNTWDDIDITPFIATHEGSIISLKIDATATNGNNLYFGSKESSNPPSIQVQTTNRVVTGSPTSKPQPTNSPVIQPTGSLPAPTVGTVPTIGTSVSGNVVSVSTSAELTAALATAKPGQTIELADGSYVGNFVTTISGTATAPITLQGSSRAILNGNNLHNGYTFHLDHANYWHLVGFSVSNAGKGVVADNSSYSVINGINVYNIGDEGIHLREGSSHDVVENCNVSQTGQSTATYGEGIYVGSAIKNWPLYGTTTDQYGNKVDSSDYNEILNNTVSHTGAENIDIKEGTTNGVLSGNTLSFPGAGSASIDVKGNNYTVVNNNISNSPTNDKGAIEVWELVTGYGQNNLLRNNSLGSTGSALGIYVSTGTVGTIIKCSNTVTQPTAGLAKNACTQ